MSKNHVVGFGVALVLLIALVLGNIAAVSAGKPTPTPPPPPPTPAPVPAGLRAGLRASNYGITPWPSPTWWVNSINSMASRFSGSTGSGVFVVVETAGRGPNCWAHFPNPDGGTYPGVQFDTTDMSEAIFDAFDAAGIKVWPQVEPSACDMSMMIDLLYKVYGHHPSVVGFGLDAEWFFNRSVKNGRPVTDAEAAAWVAQARSYNANYKVFLKHWLASHMPPTYRDGLVFIDDSQGFSSLSAMVAEFTTWGQTFAPSPVGFQFGYAGDRRWWSAFPDPPYYIGNALLANIPNTSDLVWVDFTAYDIWPPE
jgi:hypothetical protein